ncbi:MAG: hypothetical protein NTW87_04155, partial [Planctomycetota bacterium]|nr:hypothetical protein [Planctomycetota bacterium]
MTVKERRGGLRRLVKRIKAFATEGTKNTEKGQGSGFRVQGIGNDEGTRLSLIREWGGEVEAWAGSAGNSIERLCVELEISRARLTMLTKEYCGLSAQELVDGFKVRQLRRLVGLRLREAAQALWGAPGSYAATKYEMEPRMNTDEHGYDKGLGSRVQGIARKRSRH